MGIGALFGLAEPVLALDLDMVETLFEGEADHLGALRLGGTIGGDGQAHAELLEAIERLVSAGKHAQLGVVDLVEAIGHRFATPACRNRWASRARQPRESP